jgi:hypothetical protein
VPVSASRTIASRKADREHREGAGPVDRDEGGEQAEAGDRPVETAGRTARRIVERDPRHRVEREPDEGAHPGKAKQARKETIARRVEQDQAGEAVDRGDKRRKAKDDGAGPPEAAVGRRLWGQRSIRRFSIR